MLLCPKIPKFLTCPLWSWARLVSETRPPVEEVDASLSRSWNVDRHFGQWKSVICTEWHAFTRIRHMWIYAYALLRKSRLSSLQKGSWSEDLEIKRISPKNHRRVYALLSACTISFHAWIGSTKAGIQLRFRKRIILQLFWSYRQW